LIAAEAPHLAWKNRRLPLSPRSIAVRYLRRRHEAGQRRLVVRELDRSEAYFTEPAKLPGGYGAGANERIVEIPWVLARRPTGRVLDAGSSLNHVEYLDRLEPLVDELQIATLAFEGTAYPDRGISYYLPVRNVIGRRLLSALARHLGGVIWVVQWELVALKSAQTS